MNKKIIIAIVAVVVVLAIGLGLFFGLRNTNPDDSTTAGSTTAGTTAAPTYKLGLGVVASATASDASTEGNGVGEADVTVAAVIVDGEGRIVKAYIDVMQLALEYTNAGVAVANDEFKSKQELGDDYGMKNPNYATEFWGSAKEWYEHAAIFCNALEGKTLSEAVALMATEGANAYKGVESLYNAGCTIYISDFVAAVQKAFANAKTANVTANSTLNIGMAVSQDTIDATATEAGSNAADLTIIAAAMNGETVAATSTDCVQISFGFTNVGASTFDETAEIKTKLELGDDYGMKNPNYATEFWGSAKEWYEHAAAFDAACAGKTVSQIVALMATEGANAGKGVESLYNAGCTIYISDFIAAAAKLAD